MTYREYLENTVDELEQAIVILNLARKYPNYEGLTPIGKKRVMNRLLDEEMSGVDNDDDF